MTFQGYLTYVYNEIVHIKNLENDTILQLRGLPRADAPMMHPDGEHVVFGRTRVVWLSINDDSSAKFISPENERGGYPAWNDDGSALVYAVRTPTEADGLRFIQMYSNEAKDLRLPQFSAVIQPTWRGNKVAFVGVKDNQKHIYSLSTDDLDKPDVADSLQQHTTEHQFNYSPRWSRDGKKLAFERYVPTDDGNHWTVTILDVESGEMTDITPPNHNDHAPTWGPDDTHLAMEREVPDSTATQIVSYALDDQSVTILTLGGGAMPHWWQSN